MRHPLVAVFPCDARADKRGEQEALDVSKKARAKHQKTRLTVSLKVGKKTVVASKTLTL